MKSFKGREKKEDKETQAWGNLGDSGIKKMKRKVFQERGSG